MCNTLYTSHLWTIFLDYLLPPSRGLVVQKRVAVMGQVLEVGSRTNRYVFDGDIFFARSRPSLLCNFRCAPLSACTTILLGGNDRLGSARTVVVLPIERLKFGVRVFRGSRVCTVDFQIFVNKLNHVIPLTFPGW